MAYGCTKDQALYPNNYQDEKPQPGTSSILQSPKSGLKGHGCSLHLQNQAREQNFGIWVCQRPVTISKSRSKSQTPAFTVFSLGPRPDPEPDRDLTNPGLDLLTNWPSLS